MCEQCILYVLNSLNNRRFGSRSFCPLLRDVKIRLGLRAVSTIARVSPIEGVCFCIVNTFGTESSVHYSESVFYIKGIP